MPPAAPDTNICSTDSFQKQKNYHQLESTSATLLRQGPSTNRHCHNLLTYLQTALISQRLVGNERDALLLPNGDQCSVCTRRPWSVRARATSHLNDVCVNIFERTDVTQTFASTAAVSAPGQRGGGQLHEDG